MSCHGSVRIELPGRGSNGGRGEMDPKVKSQEGNPRERLYFETKSKDSLQPECTHPNRG